MKTSRESCPFCGALRLELVSNGEHNYWVQCLTCGAEGPTAPERKAWETWDIRPHNKGSVVCPNCGKSDEIGD